MANVIKQKCHNFSSCQFLLLCLAASIAIARGFSDLHFLIEPKDTIVIKGSPVELNCSASGNPSPVYEWKKEGNKIEFSDDRRVVLPNGSLLFHQVLHSRTETPDEGVYQCTASIANVGTIVSSPAKLQIASLPPFDSNPQDTTVFVDQTVYFPCSIQGIPPAYISWFKNEQPLVIDQTRMTIFPSGAIEIDAVKQSDVGDYSCSATNSEKSRRSKAGTLQVNLNYAESNRLSAPVFIATPPKLVVVKEHSNLTLDCAANGNPKPRIVWLKDGATIDLAHLDSRYRIIGVGSLYIENISEDEGGAYMCRAENNEDSVDTSVVINVLVPPSFVKRPENQEAREKEDVIFSCEVYGKPLPAVQWFKNGKSIIQSDYYQIVNGYNLRILGLVKSDAAMYQCFASNAAGKIQSSAQLLVMDFDSSVSTTIPSVTAPHLIKTPGELKFNKDAPSAPRNVSAVIVTTRFITLSWKQPLKTNGNIIAYSVYYRDEASDRERIINTTRPHLEEVNIQGLLPSTKYSFRIFAYNQHGFGEPSKELLIETQPEVHVPSSPGSLIAMPLNSTSIEVQWQPPELQKEPIESYMIHYIEAGTPDEETIPVTGTSFQIHNLREFTEYTIWVTAANKNGPGTNSEEVTVMTFADVPSDTPQNVTLEAASSSSIVIRWEPPPVESQNGIITGYKIKYKLKSGRRGGDVITTDGKRRFHTITGLEKGNLYVMKIAALSVNGTGPFTDWINMETYQNDLDEGRVPNIPSFLRARPSANSIFITWGPPHDPNIMVRGYIIGWGKGLPDVDTKTLDGKQRYYTVEDLQPSSEYVISLRAYNEAGNGQPKYETVKTLVKSTPEPFTPMLPPVGLKATVLTSSTVVLYWTDTTLSRNQLVTDNRYYTVRYTTYSTSSSPKYHYFNSTELNCMIDDLKPNTQYEFSVRVVKGKRESTWSMSVLNTTQEAAPSSPPRDLTVVPSEDDPSHINLHWQPPKQPNGHITGYVIFYTTDKTQRDRDWVVEGVVGDKMTTILRGLTLDTTYYFKIQARNSKGYGPLSSEVAFHTIPGLVLASGSALYDNKGLASSMLYIIISCVSGITLLIIIVVSVVVCRRRSGYLERSKSYKSAKANLSKSKGAAKELVPPDLWIHHDQMELKTMDKSGCIETNMTITPIQRNSQELSHEPLLSTLEKKKSAYLDSLNDDMPVNSDKCVVKCRPIRATPIKISLDYQKPPANESTVVTSCGSNSNNYDLGTNSLGRPLYPRTQYNIHRTAVNNEGHHAVTLGDPSPPLSIVSPCQSSSLDIAGCIISENNRSVNFSSPPHESIELPGDSNTLTRRQPSHLHAHALRSFTVPAPPSHSVPATPQPKHIILKTAPVVASPHKKLHASAQPLDSNCASPVALPLSKTRPGVSVTLPVNQEASHAASNVQPSESTEHLNKEMANLEGLMKDLNAITASEFEC